MKPLTAWGILRHHPRSSTLDASILGRTRAEVLKAHRESYVRVWASTNRPDFGAQVWQENYDAGLFEAVRVTVTPA